MSNSQFHGFVRTLPNSTGIEILDLQEILRLAWIWLDVKLVEAGGIEPPSEGLPSDMTTCLAAVLISPIEPPTAGSL